MKCNGTLRVTKATDPVTIGIFKPPPTEESIKFIKSDKLLKLLLFTKTIDTVLVYLVPAN